MMQPGRGYEFTNVRETPGDGHTKKLYELWDKVSRAEQDWRAACAKHEELRRAESSASCEKSNALTRLRSARLALDKEMKIPEETRGAPVSEAES